MNTSSAVMRACQQRAPRPACVERTQRAPARPAAGWARPLQQQPRPAVLARGKTISTQYTDDPTAYEQESVDLEEVEIANPLATVGDIMTSKNLRSAQPDQTLRSADSKLDKVTGLPVVDADEVVVGVISKKDMNRLRKQGVSFEEPVSKYMTTPPLVVKRDTCISEAATIMLSRKIHRLCVVDDGGKLLGLVSRTDIFDPVRQTAKLAALAAAGAAAGSTELAAYIQRSMDFEDMPCPVTEENWQIKYLYDGDCSMCLALVGMLKRQDDGRGLINFVNIAAMTYNPRENEGIEYEEAMETIHAIKRDGTILTGTDALKELYSTVGLGWAAQLGNLPIISAIVDWLYEVASKLRLPMGKQLDAVLAMRRMKMTSEGIEHCVDDEEECHAEW